MEVITGYRTKVTSSSDSESGDSEKECTDWKRAVKRESENGTLEKIQIDEPVSTTVQNSKRKRNNIWCDVLQDQMISDNLGDCGLKNKPKDYGNRGHESYDYTLKYSDPRNVKQFDNQMAVDDLSEESETSSVTSFNSKKYGHKKYVKLDRAGVGAAKKIIKILGEKKHYLIYRVVKVLGIDKAMTLLKMTEEIEETGGMMIKNNARRRTPGGVYFQLLKSDKNITKEMIDEIFEGEMNSHELRKHYEEKRKKRKMRKTGAQKKVIEDKKLLENQNEHCIAMDDDLDNQVEETKSDKIEQPNKDNLLTKPEEDFDLEDGEIEE